MMYWEYPSHDVPCKPISNLNMGFFSILECKIEKSTMKRMHASMIRIDKYRTQGQYPKQASICVLAARCGVIYQPYQCIRKLP
jgi:hypothetical protein